MKNITKEETNSSFGICCLLDFDEIKTLLSLYH